MTRRSRPVSPRLALSMVAVIACTVGGLLAAVPPVAAAQATFSNTTALPVADATCSVGPGKASPYPSTIAVSGLAGTVSDVNVTLHGLNHPFEGDFEILLVGPGGGAQNLVLLSDAGTGSLSNANLTLDDQAAALLPQNSPWGSTTAKPTDYLELVLPSNPADAYPGAPSPVKSPAPTGSATLASTFNGINPNGTWSLYVLDDGCGDMGSITGGWSLDIATSAGAGTTTAVSSSNNPSTTGQSVTVTATVTSAGSPVASAGTVTFTEGATVLAANVPVNGSGVAGFTTTTLPEGNHVITATYNGTAAFATSSGTVNQRVNNATTVTGGQYCNTGPITVNPQPNVATPYPSNIAVTGGPTNLGKVTVTLKNVTHPFPDDIDALLVGPAGQNLVLVSDAGTNTSNVTVTFDDAAAGQLAQAAPWGAANSSVTSKPVNYTPAGNVDTFPAPAPAPSAATALSTFNGTNSNGTWSLYVVSDGAPDSGTIAGGWCVTLTAAKATPTITTTASGTATIGGTVSDTATLSGGVNPTGTITFDLFGPDNATCTGTPVFTSTKTVTGDGSYTSALFIPTTPGTYRFVAAYSGDANNSAAGPTACNDAAESVVVSPTTTSTTTTLPPTTTSTSSTTTSTSSTTTVPATTTTTVAPDTTPPTCTVTAVRAGPPKQLDVTAQDTGSGLASITVVSISNGTASVPPVTSGTKSPVVATFTKTDQAKPTVVNVDATDLAGNTTHCR